MEVPPPPPKKSCLDSARNAIARTAAKIRSSHRRSAVYLKMIRKRTVDKCWFCRRSVRMTRSHVLHCSNEKLVAARKEAWKEPRRCPCVFNQPQMGEAVSLNCPRWAGLWRTEQTKMALRPRGWTSGFGNGGKDSPSGRRLIDLSPSLFSYFTLATKQRRHGRIDSQTGGVNRISLK